MGRKFFVMLILVIASTFCAPNSRAETALSYLGLCQNTWPCSASLKPFNGLPVIRTGWLEQTFGEDCKCADRLLSDPREKVIRVHLTNSACLRNKRCGKYEVFGGETVKSATQKVIQRDRKLLRKYRKVVYRFRARLKASQGGVTCYVSPCLECDLNEPARRVLRSITNRYLPQCSHVDSVLYRPCLQGSICEKHGERPKLRSPCISDLDGIPLEEASMRTFLSASRECDLKYIWTNRFNCNAPNTHKFIDPRERDCSVPTGYFGKFRRYLTRR